MERNVPLWIVDTLLDKFECAFEGPRSIGDLDRRYVQWFVDLGFIEPLRKQPRWDADKYTADDPDRLQDVTRRTLLGEYIYHYIEDRKFNEQERLEWDKSVAFLVRAFNEASGRKSEAPAALPEEYVDIPQSAPIEE